MSLIASGHWSQLQAVQQQLIDILFFLGGPVPPLYVSFPGVGPWVRGYVGTWVRVYVLEKVFKAIFKAIF